MATIESINRDEMQESDLYTLSQSKWQVRGYRLDSELKKWKVPLGIALHLPNLLRKIRPTLHSIRW